MAHDVFISYSHINKQSADAVCHYLEDVGIKCWYAPRDIAPGANWAESINNAIANSQIFILILSKHSNDSNQVIKEVNLADKNGLHIINYKIQNIEISKSLEYYLSASHWLEAVTPPIKKHLSQLQETISNLLKLNCSLNEKSKIGKRSRLFKKLFHKKKTITEPGKLEPTDTNKFEELQAEVETFVKDGLTQIIYNCIPELSEKLSVVITDVITDDIIKNKLMMWKNSHYDTLNDAISAIKSECEEDKLGRRLNSNNKYQEVLSDWVINNLIPSIDEQLIELGNRYGVEELTLKKISNLSLSMGHISIAGNMSNNVADKMLSPADMLAGLIAIISGIITYIALPTILGIVIGIISILSTTIAGIIFAILAALPGLGWVILLGIAGVAVAGLVARGWDNIKDWLSDKIADYKLPQWVRDRVSENRLSEAVNEQKTSLKDNIEEAINSEQSMIKIEEQLKASLLSQLQRNAARLGNL